MNFKSIEFCLPDAKEQTNGFKHKVKEDKKAGFFVFGKTTKQSGFHEKKSPKQTKRQTRQNMSPKSMELEGEPFQLPRPKSSYILKKKVWIDNRQNKKIHTNKLIDIK